MRVAAIAEGADCAVIGEGDYTRQRKLPSSDSEEATPVRGAYTIHPSRDYTIHPSASPHPRLPPSTLNAPSRQLTAPTHSTASHLVTVHAGTASHHSFLPTHSPTRRPIHSFANTASDPLIRQHGTRPTHSPTRHPVHSFANAAPGPLIRQHGTRSTHSPTQRPAHSLDSPRLPAPGIPHYLSRIHVPASTPTGPHTVIHGSIASRIHPRLQPPPHRHQQSLALSSSTRASTFTSPSTLLHILFFFS